MDVERLFDPDIVLHNRRRALATQADRPDFLLDIVTDELAERLSVVERQFEAALTWHAHTDRMARLILATGKAERVWRLEQHSDFLDTPSEAIRGTVADLETLPVDRASLGLIVAPLAMHLVNDLPGLLLQMRLALRPDGLLLAALPGTGTLTELRDCLLQAETELAGGASPRVIPFADVRDCGALLQRAGFALPVVDGETYIARYDTMFDLMRDLRLMGMANPLAARSRKPATRGLFLRAAELYAERYADPDGRIRASFRILYLSGWTPHESQQKPLAPGSAEMSLAKVLGGNKDS